MWATRVFTVTLMMVLPALAGGWADQTWGTAPGFTLLGAVVGLIGGVSHLLAITKPPVTKDSLTKPIDPVSKQNDSK
jgi:hypothetical protein